MAEQIRQRVLVVMKFLDIRLVLANQFNGKRERVGRIHLIVEVDLAMHGAGFQHLGL